MDTLRLPIIEHNIFSTSVLSPFDESTLYAVATRRHPEGYWIDVVYRVERDADGDRKPPNSERHTVQTELGTVSYINAGTTRVKFGDQPDHEVPELGLDMFLRRRNPCSNSRIFVASDGSTYKWRINGTNLELFDDTTHTLIARSRPRRSKFSFPVSFRTVCEAGVVQMERLRRLVNPFTAPTTAATIHSAQIVRTLSPSLSLHPSLLSRDSTSYAPQLLDGIVFTFFIMQRLLRERLKFRYL